MVTFLFQFLIVKINFLKKTTEENAKILNRKIGKSISTNHPRHDTVEDRQQFAQLLQRKLQALELRYRQEESVKEQIERINLARQKGAKTSTRELIGGSSIGCGNDSLLLLDAEAVDADEELEVNN